MRKIITLLFLTAVLAIPTQAQALILDINDDFRFTVTGNGGGRAIGFQANQDFHLDAFGIMGDLYTQSYDVVLYSSVDGASAGGVLDTWTAPITGVGFGWYDISTDYDIVNDNYYVLNWRRTDGDIDMANTIEYHNDQNLPTDLGLIELIEGFNGNDAENPDNALHPRSRLTYSIESDDPSNVIPEPATMLLFGSGLAGAFLRRKFS